MANTLPHWIRFSIAALVLFAMRGGASHADESRPWTRSTEFKEAFFTTTLESKIRVYVNAPLDEKGEPARATRIIVYTLPAGNTIEQTLGCQIKPGLHWRYDIQHVAAQIRLLRSLMPEERIVFVCPEGPGLSWSAFRKTNSDADGKMAQLVDEWVKEFGAKNARVMLTGHSNGGSFMFGVIDGVDDIPSYIDRIVFLDANYNFDAAKHVQKFQRWLKGSDDHRLVVIAYDDREIMLNGKKVLGPTGGTFRATGRMRDAFGKVFGLAHKTNPPFEETTGLDGRIHFYVHPNPQNKILHTALVGDMNGLVHAATLDTQNEEKWGKFGGPRAYTKWIQAEPAASIKPSPETTKASAGANLDESGSSRTDAVKPVNHPLATKRRPSQLPKSRPKNSVGGSEFVKSLSGLSLDDREAAILREITRGNFPEFLRTFKAVPIIGSFKKGDKEITATLEVSPDYLAVGSDKDFVRMPMTPQTAQLIADQFGCVLPTRKMVDAIDRVAEVHLAPHPMTREREAVTTFMEHHQIIEKQRGDKPLGLLVIGTKKDIVLTPRIFEKPHRLAIYGWRQLNNEPIQPLTIVHGDRYVDYSHGVRLVRNSVAIRGKMVQITELLFDPNRCGLVSDEGPMNPPQYPLK